MKPTEFEGQNLVLGKGQPEYLPLPVLSCEGAAGMVWACWELDKADLEDLMKTRKIWIGQFTFGHLFQPQLVSTVMPLEVSVAAYKARTEGESA